MISGAKISIVIPCLNEEDGIRKTLKHLPDIVDEVVVVDNGSTDDTAKVAESLGARVIHESRKGYGRAYRTGFENATGDIIVTLDGDDSYPMTSVPGLLERYFSEEVDFMSCCRFPVFGAEAMSFKHWFGNKVLSFVMSILYWTPIEDSQTGMWVFRRSILAEMKLVSNGMPLSEEIKGEAIRHPRIQFKEVHIPFSARTGEIKLRPYRDGMLNLMFLFRHRFFR